MINSCSFSSLPTEIFLQATMEGLNQDELTTTIQTLCRMHVLSKAIGASAEKCWYPLIQKIGSPALFLNVFPEGRFDARALIQSAYPILKNWAAMTPTFKEYVIDGGFPGQSIFKNAQGTLEAWSLIIGEVMCVDLMTHKKTSFPYDTKSFIYIWCQPSMASYENWLAICFENIDKGAWVGAKIDVINRSSGFGICSLFEKGHAVLQLESDQEFLYVLSKNVSSGSNKLLCYDSKDWTSSPKELYFDEEIIKFYVGVNGLLILTLSELHVFKKETCFSEKLPALIFPKSEGSYIKPAKDGFYIIDSSNGGTFLELIHLSEDFSQTRRKIQIPMNDFIDCHINLNRIFFLKLEGFNPAIYCFNLNSGELMEKFISKERCSTHSLPRFLTLSGEDCLHVMFGIEKNKRSGASTFENQVMVLDFNK